MAKTIGEMTQDEFKAWIAGNTGNSAPSKPADTSAVKGVLDAFNPLSAATRGVTGAIDTATNAYSKVKGVIDEGMGTWQKLSSTGASFSNDIVGMSAAAAGARLPLNEFADIIKSNAGNFNGLGGNAAKGAENFAKLSKEMADSGATDELRMLGMTSKDINSVLALTLSQQQTININDEKAKARAIQAASQLAFEMDTMAKLTGKSRQEQEENMRKAQADMQVEAKLRILTAGKSAEEAEAIRNNYLKQYNEAQLRGQGQMFKEVFATGTVQSQEAADQIAISGREAQATMAQARATAAGDAKAASEYSKQAQVEAMKNQNDINKLQLAAYSSNTAAGETMKKSMEANMGMYKAEQAVTLELERAGKLKGLDEQQRAVLVHEEALKRIKQEQTNQEADGKKKPGSESTEALVKLGARADDVRSAFTNGIINPINKDLGPALAKFNQGLGNAQMKDKTGAPTTKAKALEGAMSKGYEESKAGKAEGPKTAGGIAEAAKKKAGGNIIENTGETVGNLFGSGMNLLQKAGLPTRDDGTAGKTGQAVEPSDAIVKIAKGEMVLTPDQVSNMGKQISAGSKAADIGEKGINVAELSKSVKTTISSASGPSAESKPPENAEKIDMWKKLYQEGQLRRSETEKEEATKSVEEAKARLANRQATIKALKDTAATRALTEDEQHELKIAEFGAKRATNNLANRQAHLDALVQMDEAEAKKVQSGTEAIKAVKDLSTAELIEKDKTNAQNVADVKAASEENLNKITVEATEKKLKEAVASVTEVTATPIPASEIDSEMKRLASKAKASEAPKPAEPKAKTNVPDFSAMLGEGKELPPFLKNLNAQIKDIKPVEIKPPAPTIPKSPKAEVKPEEKKPEPKKEEPKKEEKKPTAAVQEVTLKDLHTSLEHLNKHMAQILNYTRETANAAQAQVKATKSLSGNKFA